MPAFNTLAEGLEPVTAYEPLMELGRGGMGTVYLARAVGAGGFERLVVVKRLNKDLLDEREATVRFLHEARHAALIHHANVVGTHQIGRDEEGFFLVLDYVEGASLEQLVDRAALRRERIPAPIVLCIALDALAGLSAAHLAEDSKGQPLHLLHRDVSLQNVLVGRDGVARLADFGIAKSTLTSVSTDHRYIVGKLLYSPPEYLARRPVGPPLDIYGLGMTLFIALSGRDPWPDLDEAQLVASIVSSRVPKLSEVGLRIAPQVDALVAKACDPDPTQRFATALEMADVIEKIGRETGWLARHTEVAAFVESLIGVDLRRRREEIAALSTPDVKSAKSLTHRSVPPVVDTTRPIDRKEAQRAAREAREEREALARREAAPSPARPVSEERDTHERSALGSVTGPVELPFNRARIPVLIAGVSALVVGGVVLVRTLSKPAASAESPSAETPALSTAAPSVTSTAAPLAPPTNMQPTSTAAPIPTLVVAPASAASAARPPATGGRAKPHDRNAATSNPGSPGLAEPRFVAPAVEAPPAPPPKVDPPPAPDGISKTNPYR